MYSKLTTTLLSASLLIASVGCSSSSEQTKPAQTPTESQPEAESQPAMNDQEHAKHEHGHHHDFNDVDKWVAHFEDPARDEWQKPKEVITLMALKQGMTIVDLGAGTGYFLPWLQSTTGVSGKVIALDVAPKLVEHMNKRAKEEGWSHVEARLIPMDDPQLEENSVDRILTVDTWHHIEHRKPYASKLAKALKPGGKIFIVEVTGKSKRKGPPANMRLSPAEVTSELQQAGLKVTMLEESLPEQYILVGEKAQ